MAEVAEAVKPQVNWEEAFKAAKLVHAKKMKPLCNASTTHISEEGKVTYTQPGNVCHNHMSNDGDKFVINGLQIGTDYTHGPGRVLAPEVEYWFVDYIINRSVYSETFVSKDAAECLAEQMTISSGDHPSNLMVAGLVALRRLWEYPLVARAAYDLSQAGVPEDLAFVLGHLIEVEENATDHSTASWRGCKAGHCSINPQIMGWKVMKNFMAHKPVKLELNAKWSEGPGSYYGYDKMYGEDYGGSIYSYVHHNFPYHLCSGEKVGASLNVFAASLPKAAVGKSVTYGKAIEVMATWATTHLMEKINNA